MAEVREESMEPAEPAGALSPVRQIPETVKGRPPTYDQHARERYSLHPDWQAYSWEAKGDRKTGFVEIKGGVYPEKKATGKYKGEPDYKKPVPGSTATLALACVEHEAWLARWQTETGYCSNCEGTGQQFSGWHHLNGNSFRSCAHCKATGVYAAASSNTPTPSPPASDKEG